MTYIALDEAQFRQLVAGKVVEVGEVRLILSDIGWDRMAHAVVAAAADRGFELKLSEKH